MIHRTAPLKIQLQPAPVTQTSSPEKSTEEAKVETELGRKRCIKFFCSSSKPAPIPEESEAKPEPAITEPAEPVKRKCAITFACARVFSNNTQNIDSNAKPHARLHSPAPLPKGSSALKEALNGDLNGKGSSPSPSTRSVRRGHRDSDSTVKLDSPKASFRNLRRLSAVSQPPRTEATRFHEFCSSEEEVEDWLQQTTCHRSRLTVEDTLKKENDIRRLTEQAEEEALEDEEEDEAGDGEDDEVDPFSDYDLEDDGFQSDIEAGFASSDEDSDDDSDYEWWTHRRTAATASSPYVGFKSIRQTGTAHTKADDTDDDAVSPTEYRGKSKKKTQKTRPVNIKSDVRPHSPELPDSTDFVCGTLDEDRPLEEAYLASLREKKALKKRACPQDIDPSFPTSDPELANDDDLDEEDEVSEEEHKHVGRKRTAHDSDNHRHRSVFMHDFEDEEPRGRKQSNGQPKRGKSPSPRRGRSPAPGMLKRAGTGTARSPAPAMLKRVPTATAHSPPPPAMLKRVPTATAHSPPPAMIKRAMTGTAHSPPPAMIKRVATGTARSPPPRGMFHISPSRRVRSPPPATRLSSPPPSRRASKATSPAMPGAYPASFLGKTERELTHTASLPRSPAPFGRRRRSSVASEVDEDDEGEETEQEKPYSRGAIDIIQGLEHKRLKRREKLYKHYWKCQEKKKGKQACPQSGKGAQRMRQIGIECAIYRGKRIISL